MKYLRYNVINLYIYNAIIILYSIIIIFYISELGCLRANDLLFVTDAREAACGEMPTNVPRHRGCVNFVTPPSQGRGRAFSADASLAIVAQMSGQPLLFAAPLR